MTLDNLLEAVRLRVFSHSVHAFTDAIITSALNDTRKDLLSGNDLPNFVKTVPIVFTSGVGSLPTDYFRRIKELDEYSQEKSLWNDTGSQTDNQVYKKVSITRFDENEEYTWKEQNGIINIFTAQSVTLNLRYIYLPPNLSATELSTDSGLPIQLDEWHALATAAKLLFYDRQYDISAQMKQQSDIMLNKHLKRHQFDAGNKIESSYKVALLGEEIIL